MPILALAARAISGVGVRIVGSEHTTPSRMPRDRIGHVLAGTARRVIYPQLDATIAVSQGVAEDLASFARLAPRHVVTITNPLDLPDLHRRPPGVHAAWPTPTGRLLAVGTLKAVKNYPLLIEALALARARREVSLVIVGDGPERDRIVAHAAARGVSDLVRFAGYTNDPWPFFRHAQAFVLSSDYEGLPTVLIEALHAGLPVVSTDCRSGPREILAGGRYGRLVACGDAEGLAAAILDALDGRADAADSSGPRRAAELSGDVPMDRHLAVMLGGAS